MTIRVTVGRLAAPFAALLALSPLHAAAPPAVTGAQADTIPVTMMMGGAISLGAFQGGAIAEMLRLFEQDASRHYAIDVMAGASAGSMTLALLAHELLYRDRFADPYASVFYQAWVERIDIDGLLMEDPRQNDTHPLSHRPVRDLGERFLVRAEKPEGVASRLRPETIYLGMTLANIEGLRYRLPLGNQDTKSVRIHTDQRFFEIGADSVGVFDLFACGWPRRVDWQAVSATAIASGAHPYAFPPVVLTRYVEEFPRYVELGADSLRYSYVDGGFFNNDPVNIAWQMSECADAVRRGQPDPNRVFFYLSPGVDPTRRRAGHELFADVDTSAVGYALRLAGMGLKTAGSYDLMRFAETRERTTQQVVELADELRAYADRDSVSQRLDLLQGIRYLGVHGLPIPDLVFLDALRGVSDFRSWSAANPALRLRPTDPLLAELAARADVDWILEYLPELVDPQGEFDSLRELFIQLWDGSVHGYRTDYNLVSSPNDSLAGDVVSAFGGFAHPELRRYDFNRGRQSAQAALERVLGIDPGPARITADTVSAWDARLNRALPGFHPDTSAALRTLFPDEDKRRMVRRRVEARVDAYSRHLKLPWLARLPAMSLVRNALDAQLYYDYRHHYLAAGWIPSIASVGRPFWQANLYTNLARAARWAQEDSGWLWWTLNYETYLGLGAGADSQLGNWYYDLSVRWHLYRRRVGWPVKVQPELGYRGSAAQDHGLDAGRYGAVGLRYGIAEMRLAWSAGQTHPNEWLFRIAFDPRRLRPR